MSDPTVTRLVITNAREFGLRESADFLEQHADECDPAYLAAVAEAMRQAADALAAMAWQPIETAPKDGTPILIDFGRIGIHRVFWSEAPFGPGIGSWCVTDIKFEDRPLRGYMHTDERGWMPLPDPPVAATAHPGADTGTEREGMSRKWRWVVMQTFRDRVREVASRRTKAAAIEAMENIVDRHAAVYGYASAEVKRKLDTGRTTDDERPVDR